MSNFGFDIGGSTIKAVRLDSNGPRRSAVHKHTQAPTPASISAGIERLFHDLEGTDTPQPSRSIGLCLPGTVDDAGVLRLAVNLPNLVGTRVHGLLGPNITGGRPPTVLTDATAAGLGAWHARPIQGRLLTLAMGTGVGAALIENGRLITLDGHTPGHVGQLDVSLGEPEPPVAHDGARGSLEAYVGLPALIARFGEHNITDAIASLTERDPIPRALARALRICCAIHKPDEIRLLGGVGAQFEPILPMLHAITSDALTTVARPGWKLTTMNDIHLAATGAARAAAQAPSTG